MNDYIRRKPQPPKDSVLIEIAAGIIILFLVAWCSCLAFNEYGKRFDGLKFSPAPVGSSHER